MKSKQQGFLVVSVLLITTISSMVALTSVAENRLQERISGNQNKELNARSDAEKTLFFATDIIKANLDKSLPEINGLLNGVTGLESKLVGGQLSIVSTGTYQGAVAYLKADILVENESGGGGPGGMVVACEGISVTAGGLVNSFDSRDGAYTAETAKSGADMVTIDGNIDISGEINLKGDLVVNGNVTQSGSTTIGGDISASGSVTLAQAAVHGNITSDGKVKLTGGTIGQSTDEASGNVSTQETLELVNGSEKSLNKNGKGAVHANGGIITPGWLDESTFSGNISTSGASSAVMAKNKCNEKDIATALPSVSAESIRKDVTIYSTEGGELEFNQTTAQMFNPSTTKAKNNNKTEIEEKPTMEPVNLTSTLWAGDKSVYTFDDFHLKNTMITIVGDITIMVKGDLITTGGEAGFKFNDGDTNSSLTILVEGKMDIGSSTKLFENATINRENEKIPLTVYSSFDSSGENADINAVKLHGDGNMYAKVYAPLGNIEYSGSGAMMGALEGKKVIISGGGAMHYDEALKYIKDPASKGDLSMQYASVFYFYPNSNK